MRKAQKTETQLRQIFIDKKISITAAADAIGISRPYLSQIIAGTRSAPAETARRIADFIGADANAIFAASTVIARPAE